MPTFSGFPGGKVRITPLPAVFFTDLMAQVDHLGELKVTLYAFWYLDRQEGALRYIRFSDFAADERLLAGLASESSAQAAALNDALNRAIRRGTLLASSADLQKAVFFLNSPRGRAALKGLQEGAWSLDEQVHVDATLAQERPNIYRLYEENIGPLTPLMADSLRDAESTYPAEWIEEAISRAVKNNARNWRYISAILTSWKEKGRDDTYRRDAQKDRRRYLEDEFADFIEH